MTVPHEVVAQIIELDLGSDKTKRLLKIITKLCADMAPAADAETDYFRRGKAVLGPSAGGVLTKLVKARGGSYQLARAVLETASTKARPAEYIGALLRGVASAERNGWDAGI